MRYPKRVDSPFHQDYDCVPMSEPKRTAKGSPGYLLNAKMMPPRLHTAIVQRGGLLARLDEGLAKKLTLISASTGSGKTTLASLWIASRTFPSAWVTLDENDNDPARFWMYLITAIRTFDPSIGKAQLSALTTSLPPSIEALLTPLINDMARLKDPCVLVLDDYQTITSEEIKRGLTFMIQHLPEALHLTLITRSDPDLPLATLRVRDELIEINTAGLRFSQDETMDFLKQALQTELSQAAVQKLMEQTEGWAAGLRLVTLSLQGKGEAANLEKSIQSFSGSDRYVADYLIKEVFESQPEAIRSFLMQTCFLSRLTGSLCDALTGKADGAVVLEELDRENMFLVQLEQGGERIWYRYSPLFAESLQYLAKQRLDENRRRELFEKASGWYETYGMYEEAIENALAVRSFEQAVTLIKKYIEIHELSEMRTLRRWLELIPTERILQEPDICLTYAQVILYSSDRYSLETARRIEPLLEAADRTWRNGGNISRAGQVSAMRGMVALWQRDFQKAFEFVHRSLEELPESDIFWRGVSLLNAGYEALTAGQMPAAQGIILEAKALLGASQNIHGVLAADQMLSEIFFWDGDLEQSAEMDRQIIARAVGGEEMLDDQGTAYLSLSRTAYERNELESAEGDAHRALDLAVQRANESLQVEATIHMAYIQVAKGVAGQADELLKSMRGRIGDSQLLRRIQETQVRLSILRNDSAGHALMPGDTETVQPLQQERETLTLARLRIAQGKADEALQAVQGRAAEAEAQGRVRSQVEALCIEALAGQAQGNMARATRLIREALKIGQARGLRRLILDEGHRMAVLLQAVAPQLADRTIRLYASALLQSFNADEGTKPAGPGLVEPLSQQEVRVLRMLAAGLSNADIARELTVSNNTVKTHVKNIYRKLSINSRAEARQMGRELNIL